MGGSAPQMLRCPFCGSTDIDITFWKDNTGKQGPGCNDCGATADSVNDWNGRTRLGDIPHAVKVATTVYRLGVIDREVAEIPETDEELIRRALLAAEEAKGVV